jgi:Uma2 family endonuclease
MAMPAVRRRWIGLPLVSPSDLELRPGTITQPDVFVVPIRQDPGDTIARWSDIRSLLLAVEVLSPSSVRTDRVEKRDLYLDADVAEYWVVDIDARVVERWTPTHATPEILRTELTWPAASTDPLAIDLPELFERVARKTGMVRL